MAHAETGLPLTPEEIGEYVCNAVKKSAAESGSNEFIFVSVDKADCRRDVCHVGNGPTSPANALLIAAAPDLLEACHAFCSTMALTPSDTPGLLEAGLKNAYDLGRRACAKASGVSQPAHESAQPCGCDTGANWKCEAHR